MTTTFPTLLAYQLECRSNSLAKDAKMVNCYTEKGMNERGQPIYRVIKRPGIDAGTLYEAGVGQGIINYYGGLRVVVNNKFFRTPLVSNAIAFGSESVDFTTSPLFMKSSTVAWVYNGATDTLTQVTDVNYPAATVPGVVQLNDTFYVMTAAGEIRGSDSGDPFTWNVLNSIFAQVEKDDGVVIAKYLNYVVALKSSTTEFFYDADIGAPASPLLRADNALLLVGCAAARSLVECDNTLVWMATAKEGQFGQSAKRIIVRLNGLTPERISTSFVEKILMSSTVTNSNVYSMSIGHNGHSFYVLTFVDSGITLVCDLESGFWQVWTSEVQQSPKTVTTATLGSDGTTVTAMVGSHGWLDGDVVVIAGASPSGYNGTYNITYVDANTFTYQTSGISDSPATGTITATGYTEQYLRFVHHTTKDGINYVLDKTNGYVYQLLNTQYTDNGAYINYLIQTPNLDANNNTHKHITRIDLVGDKVAGNALVRCSKDDYQTYTNYRPVSLALDRSHLTRWGRARRIAYNVRITDNVPVRLERMDITIAETLQ